MSKKLLCLVLIFMMMPPNCFQAFAGEVTPQLHLELEIIETEDGDPIGFGLTWNFIEGAAGYTIIRRDSEYSYEEFTVDGDKNRYADTNADFSLSYSYYVKADGMGITSNAAETKARAYEITASGREGYNSYIIIRFSVNEDSITVDKSIKGEKTANKRSYYYVNSKGEPEKVHPVKSGDTCFLPIRRVLEELSEAGAKVVWDAPKKTATFKFAGNTVTIRVLSDSNQEITFSGKQKQITGNMVYLYNDRLLFDVDAINILSGNVIIKRNTNWDAFFLEYHFNKD